MQEHKHFLSEDDIIAREDLKQLREKRLNSFNINKLNNKSKN